MKENYAYPIDPDWSKEQLLAAMKIFSDVEAAYENQLNVQAFLSDWREYQRAIPMKMDQKKIDREFEQTTSYSIYQVMKAARNSTRNTIRLEADKR
ncbi:UPF0223 family protein [Lapidilactobacillus mulanensis]|uniref:UPF0223 family protein n=1 Tax=Lapidilactobacillus mulanensis TaxID=2485999 RepID=A0ABW4DMG1_9LACO|nr:UPF0223 family protein [Lapidilactobacillus mulanensis]